MDYEELFPSAPVRYALDDIDSDEEIEYSKKINKISIQTEAKLPNSKYTVIIGLNGPGSVFIDSFVCKSKKNIGVITRIEEGQKVSMASITEVSDNLLLISFNKDIPPEEAGEYTTSLFATIHKNISRVIVLDSFSSIGYTSEVWGDELTPPFLRVLQTSTAVKIKGMTLYEVPNMIKGLSAAIINYCEIHSIACYDLLSLQESLYGRLLITEETLEAYIKGLRLFHIDMNFDRHTMKKVLEDKHQNTLTDDHHRLYL